MADDLDKENQETDFSFGDDDGGSGGDFGDFNTEQSFGSAIQNNVALKIGIIAGAIVFIIGGFILFGGGSSEQDGVSAVGGGATLKEAPTTEEVTDTMRDAIKDFNEEGQETAETTGESFIPVPVGPATNTGIIVPDEEEIQEDPLERWRLLQEERAQQQREQLALSQDQQRDPGELSIEEQRRQEAVEVLAQSMVTSMQELTQVNPPQGMETENIMDDYEYYEDLEKDQHKREMDAIDRKIERIEKDKEFAEIDPSQQSIEEYGTLLIPEGTIEYAQVLIQANSDIPGPVLAQIVTGPLAGSRLIGEFDVEDKYLVITFSTVVIDGYSIGIEAVAIDPNNNLTGVATEVDNRYFKRLVLPVAAEFIEGFASAVAETQENTFVTGDVVITTSTDLDTDEEIAQAIEDAGEILGEFVQEEADRTQILVKVAAGTPIGVLFTSPVIEPTEADKQDSLRTAAN